MEKERIRGQLLRKKPYIVTSSGNNGRQLSINELAGFEPGERVYEEKICDGMLLVISEKLFFI